MATTASVLAPAGAWTLAYTAAGTVSGIVQAAPSGPNVLVRIGASATTGDALTAAAETVFPGEARTVSLASGDKIMVRPVGDRATAVVVRF